MKRLIMKGSKEMQLVYALEKFPTTCTKSIFLAGPTPRDDKGNNWRKDAIAYLQDLGYNGTVFIPEPRNGEFTREYDNQIDWETEGLNKADCILFWIPRDLQTMPGYTTNVEWGVWSNSNKFVMGFPKGAPKTRYIEYQLKSMQQPCYYTLEDTLKAAVAMVGEGAERKDGETYVPLYVWNTPMFQNWYKTQKDVGNELRYAKVNYLFQMPKIKKVFLWILQVHVWIKDEDRIKENEFVLARTDICSAVLYRKAENIEDSEIVLVKEFRSPASNSKAMIYEIPGGSSINPEENIDVIHDEIKEELGIDIDKTKLQYVNSRQLAGTLSSHKCHLYYMELTSEQMDVIKADKSVHGVEEDTERTYIEVMTLKNIMSNDILDWSNIGMIMTILSN